MNLRWIIDSTVKVFRRKQGGKYLSDLEVGKNFLEKMQRKKKLDFIKTKNLYSLKKIVKNMKWQVTGWEKIFTIHMSVEGLVFRIYK